MLLGAGLVVLTAVNVRLWLLAGPLNLLLLGVAVLDAARLPRRAGFTARRDLPHPLSLGAEQLVLIGVRNSAAAGFEAVVADHAPAGLRPTAREVRGRFDERGELIVEYGCRPPRRGAFRFGPLDLRCWRPSGFWMRQVRIPIPEEAAVYPDVLAIRRYQLTLRRGMPFRPGQRRARPPGAATSFAGLRDYLPGDDFRRIHWKATARRDQPVTIELEAERGQQVMLLLDCGRLMTAPAGVLTKLDHAVNAALLLGWLAQQQGDRVGLLAFTDQVDQYLAPQRGPAQMNRLNEILYAVRPQYIEPDFGEAFGLVARRVTRRSLVVVLTDVLDPGASHDLVLQALWLSRRHLVLVVAMEDPALIAARDAPVDRSGRAYEWAAAEELLSARRQSFEQLRRGGVLGLDVAAGGLSPALVERYLELKERALL
ncbi:MAG: DUF58 domain-containing protein [Chloroflexi bacterium]|nr:MAG: DUF58 domain-containing protein [Chloroflexota bacterium]TME15179.1 MAG: DUF58 domain-containing protein [Chloroflexota bacterium]